jgi:hypothetical protein
MRSHEYDPATDSALLIVSYTPGRVTVVHGMPGETVSFDMDEGLFLRVVEKYQSERAKNGSSPTSTGSRKARTPKSELVDL